MTAAPNDDPGRYDDDADTSVCTATCPGCEGNGRSSGDTRNPPGSCSTCDGEGIVSIITLTVPCQACSGLGKHWLGRSWITCRACQGRQVERWQHVERVQP